MIELALIELLFRIIKGFSILFAAISFFWIFIWDIIVWNKSFEGALNTNGNGILLIVTIISAAVAEVVANRVDEIFG